MKNLAFILTAAAMLLSATNSFASKPFYPWEQRGERIKLLSNEEFFAKADYIIEAKSAGWEFLTSYDAGGNYNPDEIYTSTFMIVTYVYKNDATMSISPGDTLHYFRKGGWIYQPSWEGGVEQIWAPQPVDYDTGEMGSACGMEDEYQSIYFMKKSDWPENPDISKRSKHPKVSMLQDITRASIQIEGDGNFSGKVHGLNDLRFENRYELYKYMEQFKGVKVPMSDVYHMRWHLTEEVFNKYLKERNVKWRDPNGRQYIDSLNRVIEMKSQKMKEYKEKKKSEQGLLKASQATDELTVSIENQVVRYDPNAQKYYFIFDVYVSANNSSTYLDNLIFTLNYNTNAFNTVGTFYNGTTFNTYTYNPFGYFDTPNRLVLGIGTPSIANLSRTRLTTTPVALLKVKIELKNGLNGVLSGISYYYTSVQWFTLASNTPWDDYTNFRDYDVTNFKNPTSFTIYTNTPITLSTNFSSITVRAGTDETITITGSGFGTQKGQVFFTRDGVDLTGTSYLSDWEYLKGLDESYIASSDWTNGQIKVKVPSYVRKGYIKPDDGTPTIGHGSSAGTGKIIVRTARGVEAVSSGNLNIEYSINNIANNATPDASPIRRVYLARLSNCYDIEFTLHNSFSSNASAIAAIEAALSKWSSELGIKLALKKNSSNAFEYDNTLIPNLKNIKDKNVICFSSAGPNGEKDFLGIAAGRVIEETAGSSKFLRAYGSHIYIKDVPKDNSAYPWVYYTSGTVFANNYSFYNVILHELGHILNLNHVNDKNDLMYYTLSVANSYSVTNLTSTSKPVVGAKNIVEASKNMTWAIPGSSIIGTVGKNYNCGTLTSLTNPTLTATPYPNPAQSSFFINCESVATIKLYDILGREVLSQTASGETEVDISRLPQGIYNVTVLSEGKITGNSKIVKQ